jgi:xylose isomerase
MFWLVKFLEDVGYAGPRHFDAHAYRTEDISGVKDFARGCMKSYLILKDKAKQWNADMEIQGLVAAIAGAGSTKVGKYSNSGANELLKKSFDRQAIAARGLQYERLDQLTMEVLWGVR